MSLWILNDLEWTQTFFVLKKKAMSFQSIRQSLLTDSKSTLVDDGIYFKHLSCKLGSNVCHVVNVYIEEEEELMFIELPMSNLQNFKDASVKIFESTGLITTVDCYVEQHTDLLKVKFYKHDVPIAVNAPCAFNLVCNIKAQQHHQHLNIESLTFVPVPPLPPIRASEQVIHPTKVQAIHYVPQPAPIPVKVIPAPVKVSVVPNVDLIQAPPVPAPQTTTNPVTHITSGSQEQSTAPNLPSKVQVPNLDGAVIDVQHDGENKHPTPDQIKQWHGVLDAIKSHFEKMIENPSSQPSTPDTSRLGVPAAGAVLPVPVPLGTTGPTFCR